MSNQEEVISKTGFLGNTPDFKILEDRNLAVANFSIAINNKDGETNWVNCVAWGEEAQKAKDFQKGSKISVTGVERTNQKDDKTYHFLSCKEVVEHQKVQNLEVRVGNLEFKTPKSVELGELAVYANKEGSKESEYLKIVAFGNVKEKLKQEDIKAGDKLIISADGKPYSYTNKEGEVKSGVQYTLIDFEKGGQKQEKETDVSKAETKEVEVASKEKKSKKSDISM
jgi:single-stranded DNA-binding protein